MEDYRLEQQKNIAANILIHPPSLNLYAYKHSLPPAIARFRLLQVISQSPDEADPTGDPSPAGSAQQDPGPGPAAPNAQPAEAQPAQPAAREPEQGPQAPPALLSSSDSEDSESDWPSDLDTDDSAADQRRVQHRAQDVQAAPHRYHRLQRAEPNRHPEEQGREQERPGQDQLQAQQEQRQGLQAIADWEAGLGAGNQEEDQPGAVGLDIDAPIQ